MQNFQDFLLKIEPIEHKISLKFLANPSIPYTIFNPAGHYLFKVNNRNTRTKCEICSNLKMKTSELRQWRRFGVFVVNFEHISHLVLVFSFLTLDS